MILIEFNAHSALLGLWIFAVFASPVVVRGLAINRAPGNGINVGPRGPGAVIAGNFIGTDASGLAVPGLQTIGVSSSMSANNVLVGGTNPADRNVIAGNTKERRRWHGLELSGEGQPDRHGRDGNKSPSFRRGSVRVAGTGQSSAARHPRNGT